MTMKDLLPLNLGKNFDWDEVQSHAIGGMNLALTTFIFTVVLELCSMGTVRQVWKYPNGRELYMTSISCNLINHFFIGVPTYLVAAMYLCTKEEVNDDENAPKYTGLSFLMQVLFICVAHSLQYYYIHKAFHESPVLYRTFHRFHHRFNTHVPPSAANAVTMGEYALAYVMPFAIAALVGRTSLEALRIAVMLTSLLNLLVHTPRIEAWSERWTPFFWVSTSDHLNHHRNLNVHYASPLFDVDSILQLFNSKQGFPMFTGSMVNEGR
jgi:sterol desaturase/sphingolipid hydroxylase (fatty acid hydroxylase superfamily)